MAERAYTVAEIDALRRACEDRYHFGTTYWPPDVESKVGWPCDAKEKAVKVE